VSTGRAYDLGVICTQHSGERPVYDVVEAARTICLDEQDLEEFRGEPADALIRAVALHDSGPVSKILEDWRRSADTLSDPLARAIMDSDDDLDEDLVDVDCPGTVTSHG
jgi:hypothetical protein